MRRAVMLHVESELEEYHNTAREVLRMKNEILFGVDSSDDNIGGGRSNVPGDPTGRAATLLMTHKRLNNMQAVIDAITTVYESLPPEKRLLVRLKYWTRPQLLTWDGIARELSVSERQARRWRTEIVAAIANRLGWE